MPLAWPRLAPPQELATPTNWQGPGSALDFRAGAEKTGMGFGGAQNAWVSTSSLVLHFSTGTERAWSLLLDNVFGIPNFRG